MKSKDASLDRECGIFFHYLCDLRIDPYILAKYREAHCKVPAYTPSHRFDRLLVRFATRGPIFARMADSYSRFFAPRSALRKKLILLIAILETSTAASPFVDQVDSKNRLRLAARLLLQGIAFLASLAAGAALLSPCHLVCTLIPSRDIA